MQDQVTPAAAASPAAPPRGRYVLTLVIDGIGDAVASFLSRTSAALRDVDLDLAQAGSVGPLPADHELSRLPIIQIAAQSSSVVGDGAQGEQPVQLDSQVQAAPVAAEAANDGAQEGADSAESQADAVVVPDQPGSASGESHDAAGEQPDNHAGENVVIDNIGGVVGAGVQPSGIVADSSSQASSGEGSPEVSAPTVPDGAHPDLGGAPAPTTIGFDLDVDTPPTPDQIRSALEEGAADLERDGNIAAAVVLRRAIGKVAGISVEPVSSDAETPAPPDPSPHPDPVAVNPSAR